MKNKVAVSLVSAAATLTLVLSLIACSGTEEGTVESFTYPEVPNIPMATETAAGTSAQTAAKDSGTQTEPATAADSSSSDTASDSPAETSPEPAEELSESVQKLKNAAIKTACTDGAYVTVVRVNRLTDSIGQSTEVRSSTVWRRVGGNCTLSGVDGYTLLSDTVYLSGRQIMVSGLTETQIAWFYENYAAPGLLPFDPAAVQTLNASGKSVTVSGIREQYRDALLKSLQISAADMTLTEVTGAAALNADGTLADASFRVSVSYTAEGEAFRQDVEYICTYSYGAVEAVAAPSGSDACQAVSFRDAFGTDAADSEKESETETETASEPQASAVLYVTATALNVRSSPDFKSDSNIVGYLKKGDRVVILADYGDYAVIEYSGKRCYIGTHYLSDKKPE